jgi:flavin-dependent dehydrogenase
MYGSDEAGPWRGFQVPRAVLDDVLLTSAIQAGAVVHQPVWVTSLSNRCGRVTGVETTSGYYTAQVVIDGAGGRHWLARRIGIAVRRLSLPLVAAYGYATGPHQLFDDNPTFRIEPGGWVWVARVAASRYHWTRLTLKQPTPTEPPAEYRSLEPSEPARREDVTWRVAERLAGPGFFLTGDAAGVLDPASSHGVLRAVMSGMLAGHLAARVVSGADENTAVTEYQNWLTGWFTHDVEHLRQWYWSVGLELPAPDLK